MHARNRTWPLGSDPAERCRQRTLPVEGGDGSTLSLDFTTGVLDPRLTFTRTSDATFINSSGLVQWANANIVRHSENCTNWGGAQNITPTADAAVAPNGTQTADQLNLLASSYRYNITATSPQRVVNGVQYTGSIWIRAVSGTASVTLRINNNITGGNQGVKTVTVTETWTREFVSFTLSSSTGTAVEFGLDQRSIIGGANVAANVYVWGMQIQPGNVVGEYLPTTTTENYNTPRFDHDPTTLAPRGLLIEGQATNLLPRSEDFTNAAWINANTDEAPDSITAPNGQTTADSITETAINDFHIIYQSIGSQTAGTFTTSMYLKKGGRRYVALWLVVGTPSYGVMFDLDTNSVSATKSNDTPLNVAHSITDAGNGWVRVTVTAGTSQGATFSVLSILTGSNVANFSGSLAFNRYPIYLGVNGTVLAYAWGAQLETGSGASSYIPTGASQVTRTADVCYADSISSWYTQGSGTMLFVGRTLPAVDLTRNYMGFSTGTAAPRMVMYSTTATDAAFFLENTTSLNLAAVGTSPRGNIIKLATAFATANHAIVMNGGTVASSTAATPTVPSTGINRVNIGVRNDQLNQFWGHVMQVKYWPTRLPNAQLQSLTT